MIRLLREEIHPDFIRNIRRNKKILVDVFNETFKDGPDKCVEELIKRLGKYDTKEIIANMANAHGDWDARISKKVYDWAKEIGFSEEELAKANIYYCDDIHPAHFNQIAEIVSKIW